MTARIPQSGRRRLPVLLCTLCFALSTVRAELLLSAPYPDLATAVSAAEPLAEWDGAIGLLKEPPPGGFRLVLADSSDPDVLERRRRAAAAAGLSGLQIAPLPPDASPPVPLAAVEVKRFTRRAAAEHAATDARREGAWAELVVERAATSLIQVKLEGYADREAANRDAVRLREAGIEFWIPLPDPQQGWSIQAGVFRSAEHAGHRIRRLRALDFDNVRQVPLVYEEGAYRVVTLPRAQGATPATEGVVLLKTPAAPPPPPESPPPDGTFRIGLERMHAESGVLADSAARAEGSHYLHGTVALEGALNRAWELRLAGRFDTLIQRGEDAFERTDLDYGESYLRYRDRERRVTFGTQRVVWGRVDELPPTDRLAVQDATRLVLDDYEARRRAVGALRWEEFAGAWKLDLLYLPRFREAELPPEESIWSPVDRSRGRLLGLPDSPTLAALVAEGRFITEDSGHGGWGVRLSRGGERLEYALTLQSTRHSLPYYSLHPAVRSALLADPVDIVGALASAPTTFIARHPRTRVAGGDLGFAVGGYTFRFEAVWLSDQPATSETLRYLTLEAAEWVAGVEFFPGDAELRVTLQLGGQHLLDAQEPLLEEENRYTLFGELESHYLRHRWRGRLRFSHGLDRRDLYLNPEFAFLGREPHEFYLGYHHFQGEERSLGGFHENHNLLTLGWRGRF